MALIYTYSKTKVGHIQIDPFLNYLHKLLKSCQVRQSAFEISTFQMFIFLRNYLESEMTTKFCSKLQIIKNALAKTFKLI